MGFMDQAFETVIVFSAVDMVTAPMMKMAGSMGLVSQRSAELQATLNGYRNMAFIGAGITAIGAVMATGLVKASDAAGQLQTSMMGVKEALGLTNAEFQKAINMSMTMGIPTIFSAQQVGGIMATAANAGLTKAAVLNPDIMRQYVNFADVQAQGTKQEDPNTVIAAAVKMTNLAQISGVQNTSTFLDELNAALMHTTDTATQFATNMRYYTGTAQLMGMSASDILTTNAWLSRMGLGGGRGGMATQQFLSRSIYGSSGAAADTAMQTAGFVVNGRSVFEDAKGAFIGIPAASKIMQDFGVKFHEDSAQMVPLLKSIFGVSGERVAMAMANPAAATQYANIQQQLQTTAGVNATQAALNATWQGQTKQMTTTLQDIWTNFGFAAMQNMLPLVTNLNKILSNVLAFEQAHPVIMNLIADFIKWGAGIALTVGPLMTFVGVLGWIKESGYVVTGLQMIGGAFKMLGSSTGIATAAQWLWNAACDADPMVWVIAGIVALGVALVELVAHWQDVVTWIKNAWNWLTQFDAYVKGRPAQTGSSVAAANAGANAGLGAKAAAQVTTAVGSTFSPLGGGSGARYAYASGTGYASGGWSLVGENGPELLNIPTGSKVIDNASLNGILGAGGVYVAPGAIVINPQPNHNPTQIATATTRALAGVIRNNRRSRGLQPVTAY